MPEVFREGGFVCHFYSNEGTPREPPHIHVQRGRDEAKFWLRPFVTLGYNDGLKTRELREAALLVARERDRIERKWNEYFT